MYVRPHDRHTHCGGCKPWNREPGKTSRDITWQSVSWGRGNGLIPVAVIQEDCGKVLREVDPGQQLAVSTYDLVNVHSIQEEDTPVSGFHSQIATASIAVDRMTLSSLGRKGQRSARQVALSWLSATNVPQSTPPTRRQDYPACRKLQKR